MSKQIIQQPNGQYLIFSTIVDHITHYNMGPYDIIEALVAEARNSIEKDVLDTIDKLEKGERPYYQFTKTYPEILETICRVHGRAERIKVKKLIEP